MSIEWWMDKEDMIHICNEKLVLGTQSLNHVWFFVTPCTIACQAALYMEFFRQEYWIRVLFLTPGDLPNAVTEPTSVVSPALAGGFFNHCVTWEASTMEYYSAIKTDQNNTIFRNMDGPQDYHTKWNKPDKVKYHMISLICEIYKSNKMIQMNLFTN